MLSKNLEIKYGEALICLVCTIKNSDKIIFLYFIKNHIGHLTKKKNTIILTPCQKLSDLIKP